MEEVTILRGSEEYNETLDDIERSLGIVPGFMRAVPADVLVAEWALVQEVRTWGIQSSSKI